MIKTIGGNEFTFNTKLGTTLKIKKRFNKPFNAVLENIDKMDVEDLIRLLHCGIDENETPLNDFKDHLLETIGLMELYELVQSFIKQIQYPGLSDEEIDAKLKEKNLEAQAMQNMTSLKNS